MTDARAPSVLQGRPSRQRLRLLPNISEAHLHATLPSINPAPSTQLPTSRAWPVASVPSTARFMSTWVSILPAVRSKDRSTAAGRPARRYTPAVAAVETARAVAAAAALAAQPLLAQPAAPAAIRKSATLPIEAGTLDSSQAAAGVRRVASNAAASNLCAGLERSGPP